MTKVTRQRWVTATLAALLAVVAAVAYHYRTQSQTRQSQLVLAMFKTTGNLNGDLAQAQYIVEHVVAHTRPQADLREAGLALVSAEQALEVYGTTAPQFPWDNIISNLHFAADDLMALAPYKTLTPENRQEIGDILALTRAAQQTLPVITTGQIWRVDWNPAAIRAAEQVPFRRPPRRLGDIPAVADLYAARLTNNTGTDAALPQHAVMTQQVLAWLSTAVVTGPAPNAPWPNDAWYLVLDLPDRSLRVLPDQACLQPDARPKLETVCQEVIVDEPGEDSIRLKAPELARWLATTTDRPAPAADRRIAHVVNHHAGLDRWLDVAFPQGAAEVDRLQGWLTAAEPLADAGLQRFPIGVPMGLPYLTVVDARQRVTAVEQAYRCAPGDGIRCTLQMDAVLVNGHPVRSAELAHYLITGRE